ncbi:MAG: hypothetical protein KatS3mg053_1801 [Candidatus Roseilinea sp.]|nr:MAG: hypothetical protein KatS3mg053_1801 [Candidatus Roseilinea sp.]
MFKNLDGYKGCEQVILTAVLALMISMTTSSGSIQAQSAFDSREPTLIEQQIIPMQLDCSTVPQTNVAEQMLKEHGLCGYANGQAISTASHSTDATVSGNCGSLSLNLFSSGNGIMQWQAIITSSQGPFVSAGYNGDWQNISSPRGGSGVVNRSTGVTFTSYWQDDVPVFTGSGIVRGQITGAYSQLWWGPRCYGLTPLVEYGNI